MNDFSNISLALKTCTIRQFHCCDLWKYQFAFLRNTVQKLSLLYLYNVFLLNFVCTVLFSWKFRNWTTDSPILFKYICINHVNCVQCTVCLHAWRNQYLCRHVYDTVRRVRAPTFLFFIIIIITLNNKKNLICNWRNKSM